MAPQREPIPVLATTRLADDTRGHLVPQEKILVVDDSPTEQRLVAAALQGQGYTVSTAADGEEALVRVARERPDVIVLGVLLPKVNGFEVCRRLKGSPQTRGIKVVLLSGRGQDSDRYRGLKHGADASLGRPAQTTELLDRISKLL